MHVLDDKDRRRAAGQGRSVDHRGNPPAPCGRIDLGQNRAGLSDTQEVVQEQEVLGIGIGEPFVHAGSRRCGVESTTSTTARSSPAAARNGTSLVCESQYDTKTWTPQRAASAVVSLTIRLLPMPAGPTTPTTLPLPLIADSEFR